ncbi:hypothetical protein ACLKA7_017443 [Drosophila subpalustris]
MVKRIGLKATKKLIPWQKPAEEPVAETTLNTLISEEEWMAREQRHHQRIQDVKVCLGFISESVEGYEALVKLQSINEHWNRYVNCDGLPRVQEPPELRRFLAEILHVEDLDEKAVVNWALSVDECSILTQDIDAVDLTRKSLKKNLCPNIGKLYDDAVQRILIVLSRIQLLLDSEFELAELRLDRAIEISRIRIELNQAIDVLFDKLTYRIICAPSSYQTLIDGITESYCYKSSKFHIQIWWLSDVNIRFKYLELPLMVAKLDCVGVKVQIPMRVLRDNLTLRCVHTFFDFVSENAKSYDRIIDKSTSELNAGMTDIEDCLINEWLMQVSILNQKITRMEQKCIMYEENMRELEPKVAHLAKQDSNAKHKIKLPKEPQKLPEGKFPDPYKNFLEQEQQELNEFLDQYLSPQNLQLLPDEINLRRFRILGGIFSMGFVHKPKHTDFTEFNRTFHDDKRMLYTMDHLRAFAAQDEEENDVDDDELEKAYVNPFADRKKPKRKSGDSTRSRVTVVSQLVVDVARNHDKGLHLQGDDVKYFFVSIQLPEQLCRYGEPLACQYLDEFLEEDEPEDLVSVEPEEHRVKRKRRRGTPRPTRDTARAARAVSATRAAMPAFGHSHGPSQRLTSKMGAKSTTDDEETRFEFKRPAMSIITPRSSVANNIYRTSYHNSLRSFTLRRSFIPGITLRNFKLLDEPLDNAQINDLKQHCLPRILSSFKFPKEFKIEKFDAFTERTKGNKILRRNPAVINEVYTDEPEYFSYEKQEAPERLYPMFDRREKVIYEQESSPVNSSSQSEVRMKVVKIDQIAESVRPGEIPGQTMYSVLQALEEIQTKYLERPGRLLKQQTSLEFKNRSRSLTESPIIVSPKTKSTVRISTMGSKLVHIPPRTLRSINRQSFSSLESTGSPSIGSVVSVAMRHGKSYGSRESPADKEESKRKVRQVNVKHWTTKHIVDAEFNRETFTVTIKTDRLGLFGFAYKLYEHFPFRDWKLQQNEEQPNEIIFTLDTFHVRVILFISNAGIRGYVTKIVNEYVANPVKYMEIKEPISDYRELRRRFLENNINIFAELDACYYIENGYFSEKHLSTELHIYDAFAVHCKLIKFYRCDWNRLAPRRDLILCLRNPRDLNDGADVTVRVTPDSSTFVEVYEPCSLELDEVKLAYRLTWRNIGTYSDLHQLINSMYPQATDVRNRDPKLIHYIRTLFTEAILHLCLGQLDDMMTPSMRKQQLVDIMKSNQGVQSRVIGGELTTIEKLGGYLVALRYNKAFICGGTLIEERFVVSAAHCFLGRTQKSAWVVVGGISRLTESGVQVQLMDFVVPAVFEEGTMHMDVAVLLLKTPLKGVNIATASLCTRRLNAGLLLTVSGWGLVDPNGTAPTQSLRTVTVPIISKSQCRQSYKNALKISKAMFCAGVLGTKDACTFDSGGPLVYEDPDGVTKELCGIVSFGISCASPKYAGVYTDVNYVKPFIEKTIDSFKKSLV